MKKQPKAVYIIENGEYTELTYEEFRRREQICPLYADKLRKAVCSLRKDELKLITEHFYEGVLQYFAIIELMEILSTIFFR